MHKTSKLSLVLKIIIIVEHDRVVKGTVAYFSSLLTASGWTSAVEFRITLTLSRTLALEITSLVLQSIAAIVRT
jgi:hypothetical protein